MKRAQDGDQAAFDELRAILATACLAAGMTLSCSYYRGPKVQADHPDKIESMTGATPGGVE